MEKSVTLFPQNKLMVNNKLLRMYDIEEKQRNRSDCFLICNNMSSALQNTENIKPYHFHLFYQLLIICFSFSQERIRIV